MFSVDKFNPVIGQPQWSDITGKRAGFSQLDTIQQRTAVN
jgi:hypothetical protein